MNQIIRSTPRLHPLLAAAAVSVVIVSAAGVGVMTGVLPGSHAGANAALAMPAPVAAPVAPQFASSVAAAPAPLVSAQSAPAPKPAARPRAARAPVAERAYDDELPVRRTATLPAVSTNAPRSAPYDPNPYGGYGNAQGGPQGGYGGGQGGVQGPYGSAPVQVSQASAIPPPVVKPVCANCGVVESVIENTKPGEGSGIGIAGGALGGAVVGKQFGKGRGSDALAVLGALGGAFAGHQVEKSVRSTKVYEVRVRMTDGSTKSLTQSSQPGWRPGDHVRVEGDSLRADNAS